MNWRVILSLVATSLLCIAQTVFGQTPTTVVVEVHSGRQWTGVVDASSNADDLVLRFERGNAHLRRPIRWNQVRTATVNGRSLSADELRGQLKALATPPKPPVKHSRQLHDIPSHSDLPFEETQPAPQLPARITSIACDALLANWDGDVEADGLVIYLQPIDARQQFAAVSGTLEVELFTLLAREFHHAPFSGGRSVEPIIRWSQAVNLSDYTSRGAQMKLPFQAAHPEFDDTLGAYGLVHIKLSVPGSGVFEQTIDGVRIRPWSPLRDYLQLDTGRRFLPHETTGRAKTAWPNAYP